MVVPERLAPDAERGWTGPGRGQVAGDEGGAVVGAAQRGDILEAPGAVAEADVVRDALPVVPGQLLEVLGRDADDRDQWAQVGVGSRGRVGYERVDETVVQALPTRHVLEQEYHAPFAWGERRAQVLE